MLFFQSQQVPQAFGVIVVLPKGILKPLTMSSMDFLRPLAVVFAAKDPSLVVFCLYEKDPVR